MKIGNLSQAIVKLPVFFGVNCDRKIDTFQIARKHKYYRPKEVLQNFRQLNFNNNFRQPTYLTRQPRILNVNHKSFDQYRKHSLLETSQNYKIINNINKNKLNVTTNFSNNCYNSNINENDEYVNSLIFGRLNKTLMGSLLKDTMNSKREREIQNFQINKIKKCISLGNIRYQNMKKDSIDESLNDESTGKNYNKNFMYYDNANQKLLLKEDLFESTLRNKIKSLSCVKRNTKIRCLKSVPSLLTKRGYNQLNKGLQPIELEAKIQKYRDLVDESIYNNITNKVELVSFYSSLAKKE